MTRSELRMLRMCIRQIRSAQAIADKLEINMGNGAEVGSLLGSMADELEIKEKAMRGNS